MGLSFLHELQSQVECTDERNKQKAGHDRLESGESGEKYRRATPTDGGYKERNEEPGRRDCGDGGEDGEDDGRRAEGKRSKETQPGPTWSPGTRCQGAEGQNGGRPR